VKEQGCTFRDALFAVGALEHPDFVTHLVAGKIPGVIGMLIQVHRLAHEMGEDEIGRLPVAVKVEGAKVPQAQRKVPKGAKERTPDADGTRA
jgi:hypothetical protein